MNVNKINSIILEVLDEFKHPIQESAMGWESIKDLLDSKGIRIYTDQNGIETAKLEDSNLGVLYIQANGNVYVDNEQKYKPWIYNSSKKIVTISGKEITALANVSTSLRGAGNIDANELERYKKKKAKSDSEYGMDIFQTILDWLGFIPGYGDIIDAINAIMYFSRGKNIDGFLSLIAIIPVVGSGIKLSFKGAIQSIQGTIAFNKVLKQAKAGNITALADFYRKALEMGKLDKVQLRQIAQYGDTTAAALLGLKQNILSTAGKGVHKQLDETAKLIRDLTSNAINQSTKKAPGIFAKGAAYVGRKAKGFVNTSLNVATFGGWGVAKNLVKKLGIGTRELKQLQKAVDVKYIKQIESDSVLTTMMFKQLKRPSGSQAVGQLGIPPWLWSKQTKDISAWFENLKNTDPMKWKQVSNSIAQQTIASNNPYYVKFAGNYFQQASGILTPGTVFKANAGDILPSLLKLDTYRLSNPKNLDIVANEIEDLAEKIGLDPQDDPNGVILSALYMSVMSLVDSNPDILPTVAGAAGVVTSVTDMTGLTNFGGGSDESKPEDEKITVTDDLEKVKNDFKSSNGTTTDRLKDLKDKGYSDEEILKFKRQLDID